MGVESSDVAAWGTGELAPDAVRLVQYDAQPATNLSMQGFSVDAQSEFSVAYSVVGQDAPPFTIGIYGSPDGRQPVTLLQTYDISDPSLVAGSTPGTAHTVSFAPDFGGLSPFSASENGTVPFMHCLLAKLDVYDEVYETSKSDNLSGPLAGAAFQASNGDLYVLPGTGSQSVGISQDPASGEISVGGMPYQGVGTIYVSLGGSGNTVTIGSGVTAPVVIYGGAGGDTITDNGSGGAEIHGGTAANTITLSGSGNDTVYAGPDGDTISDYGSGNNQIYGGAGTDTITESGSGDDWIQLGDGGTIDASGSTGDDWLYAGSGSDTITGGGGNDVIQGGSGTNTLIGGTRLDEITGGSGTNFIYGNGEHDVLVGGTGWNKITPDSSSGHLASLEVQDHGTETSCGYYENTGQFPHDGNIDQNGTPFWPTTRRPTVG